MGVAKVITAFFADDATAEKMRNIPSGPLDLPAVVVKELSGSELAGDLTGAGVSVLTPGPTGMKSVKYITKSTKLILKAEKGRQIYKAAKGTLKVAFGDQSSAPAWSPGTEEPGQKTRFRGTGKGTVVISLECPKEKGKEFGWHKVRPGDHLWKLWRARTNKGISWDDMKLANDFLKDISYIYPGHYVCADYCISGEKAQAAPAPTK